MTQTNSTAQALSISTDNTTHKLTEETSLTVGALQKAIFNSVNFCSIATDARGVIQIFNVGAERMLGYTAAEVINRITPADITEPQEVLARAKTLSGELGTQIKPGFEALSFKASRGIEDIYELTYVRKDGSRLPAVISVTVLRDAQATIIGYLLISTDNTLRKQAEQELRQSQALTQSVINGTSDAVYVKDIQGRYLMFNSGASRIVGKPVEAVLGEDDTALFPPDEARQVMGGDRRVMVSGATQTYEEFVTASDGVERTFLSTKGPVRDAQGAVIGLFGIARDITERKQTEIALLKSETKYRQIVENSPDVVYAYSMTKGGLYYSSKVFEVLGYTVEHMCANPFLWSQSIHPEDRATVAAAVHEFKKGVTFKTKYRIKNARGEWRWLFDRSIGSREENGDLIVEGLAMDITDSEQLEAREREAASRAERAMLGTVKTVSKMMDLRDPYTAGHERRVGQVASAIAAEMGLSADVVHGLQVAGNLHDVGKINVPAEILSKPGKLSALEFELIKAHAEQGYQVLKDIDFPWPVAEVAYQHHERIDGSGYPRGLKGDEIVLEARILTVADVVEAMSSHRPYRAGAGIEKAVAEIERGRGTAYDAKVVDACVRLFREKGYSIPA